MADVVQKIITGNPIRNGKSVVYVPHKASLYQGGGYNTFGTGTVYNFLTPENQETQYTNRLDQYAGADNIVNTFETRSQIIGISATQLTGIVDAVKGYQLKANASNTGVVYIGTAGVTANTSPDTDGFPLSADQGLFLPLNNSGAIYAIASVPNCRLHVLNI
jgi:hypothetical protein